MRTIKCEVCKSVVTLDGSFTSTCNNCGADYNSFGQLLDKHSSNNTIKDMIEVQKECEVK